MTSNSNEESNVDKPKPSNALLSQLADGKQLRKTTTRVRTRDGKIFEEERKDDGSTVIKSQNREPIPAYLDESTSATKTLPIYTFDVKKGRWIGKSEESTTSTKTKVKSSDDKKEKPVETTTDNNIKELVIISFNVWFANEKWQERQQKLLQILKGKNPDIICLQEVTPRFMEGFCKGISKKNKKICKKKKKKPPFLMHVDNFICEGYDISDNMVGNTVNPYGVLIATRKKTVPMTRLEISSLPSNMARRLVSAKVGPYDWWINTVHLESLNNTPYRVAQLKLIFNDYMGKQGENCMLMGDFNFGERDEENAHLSKNFLDCWTEFAQQKKLSPKMGATCVGERYDRIVVKWDKKSPWKITHFEKLGGHNMPSDHLGICAILTKD
ncbi:hypothetical protein RFI_20968 [Reticulomyxa filosa]|uniref:Endonuclease/exonuclease/phosphatase domain-containing protein n=1 Tax=Reticulomyxa filosa TaxID=46433 RepID=X6MSI0_RETFI|nr:hypothetical protein RFI_20968 [Reticulomyxa filosa]|eukprot:ETO16377.1 hypothetical protein RFI_20968 [Reticulomyxa filosa]